MGPFSSVSNMKWITVWLLGTREIPTSLSPTEVCLSLDIMTKQQLFWTAPVYQRNLYSFKESEISFNDLTPNELLSTLAELLVLYNYFWLDRISI